MRPRPYKQVMLTISCPTQPQIVNGQLHYHITGTLQELSCPDNTLRPLANQYVTVQTDPTRDTTNFYAFTNSQGRYDVDFYDGNLGDGRSHMVRREQQFRVYTEWHGDRLHPAVRSGECTFRAPCQPLAASPFCTALPNFQPYVAAIVDANCRIVRALDPGEACVCLLDLFIENCVGGVTFTVDPPLEGRTAGVPVTITTTARDAAGRTATCTKTVIPYPVNVLDDLMAPVTLEANANCLATLNPMAVPSCVKVTYDPPLPRTFGPGRHIVQFTLEAGASGFINYPKEVIVVNSTPPTITCPAEVTLGCATPSGAVATYTATATDNCDPAHSLTCTPASGSTFPPGTTTVTCTATDASGNSTMCSFTVTVAPNNPPTANAGGDSIREATHMRHFISTSHISMQRIFFVGLVGFALTIWPAVTSTTLAIQEPKAKNLDSVSTQPTVTVQEAKSKDPDAALTSTAFTYQGQLKDANGPVTGSFDLQFVLYSAQAAGQRLGASEIKDVALTNGLFSFKLDFGRTALEAKESWLEIGVRPSGSAEPYTVLFPRQKLTPTPYAIFAQHEPWSLIGVPVGFADRVATESEDSRLKTQDPRAFPLDDQQSAIRNPQSAIEAASPQATQNFIAKFDSRGQPFTDSIMRDDGTTVTLNNNRGPTNPLPALDIASGRLSFSSPYGDIQFTETVDLFANVTTPTPKGTDTAFRVATGTGLNVLATMLNNGFLGLGTATPQTPLEIVNFAPVITLRDVRDNGYNRPTYIQNAGGALVFKPTGFGFNDAAMVMSGYTGSVGIGTT
ncbi:MAG: HYR domain-containing protein, partial [Acidobacteria bacterium]|nr:HYR domain-containing protein [Acidobacteriota bacterium]